MGPYVRDRVDMAERRQAARREPIEIETADGRVFIAHPLPWMQANDLGNEIMRQNVEAANDLVHMWIDDAGLPELQMAFHVKIKDWNSVLKLAFPGEDEAKFHDPADPSSDECADLVIASLEVNHLEHLRHLVDPNSPTPMKPGGTSSSQETEGESGTKTTSMPSSEPQDSTELTPSI